MSLTISHIALHQLEMNDQDELVVNYRDNLLDLNASAYQLVAELHRVYNAKAGKGFGSFLEHSEFNTWLTKQKSKDIDYYEFSKRSAERLKNELTKYPFADTGVLIFAQYQSLATDYLFIAILPSIESLKVDSHLDVGATDHLNVTGMTVAARIDLTTMEFDKDSNRYVSFLKGRVGRKVSDFFLDYLQVDTGFDTKQQNQVLMQAVEDFCSDGQLDKEETTSYKKQVHDYCNEQLNSNEEIVVKELSSEVPLSEDGTSLYNYTQDKGYELEESFPADRTAIRKLTKYVGAGGGLSISFDSTMLGERIFYDPETDTLTIKGTPPNLKDQLIRVKQ